MKENTDIVNEVIDSLLGIGETRRVYVAVKQGELLGVFSNRKILLGALQQSGVPENAFIKGARMNKSVSVSSVANGFNNKVLNIYHINDNGEEYLLYRVWELTFNKLNPKYT